MISKIKNVAALYRNKMAKISPDLKDSIQKSMRDEINKDLKPHLKAFQGQVDAMVKEFAQTRRKNLDRRYLVATRATNSIKDLTLGESRLMDIIATSPASVLSGIVSEDKVAGFHGLVRLALLNQGDELTKPSNEATTAAGAAEAKAGYEIGQQIINDVLKSEPVDLDRLRTGAADLANTCQAMGELSEAAGEPGYQKMYAKYAEEVVNQTQDAIEAFQDELKGGNAA
jgi:hypothetical protein